MKQSRNRCPTMIALLAAVAVAAADVPRAAAAEKETRPNIVFVLVDDLRWDALGCTGHPFARTPNIDRIAREGMTFRNTFVTTPLCSPSRASFLTGLYAHTHHIEGNGDSRMVSHKLVTFPRLLQGADYATAYIGKWHMGDDDSPRPGFNRWVSFKGQGHYENPELNIDGKVQKAQGYVTDILTDHAVEFLKQPREKPFVLYLAHKAVHAPFHPAERHQDLFTDQALRRAPSVRDSLEGKPILTRKLPQPERAGQNPGTEDRVVLGQLRGLAAIDEGIGRLFRALEESGQLDRTLLIFTSDNGFFWGEHGLGDKRAAYEESIRIPLLMRYPRLIRANSTRDQLVLNVDIAPSLLDLAGLVVPKDMHGTSLLPLLKNEATNWRTSFLAEYFAPEHNRIPAWQAVRTTQWKYIHYTAVADMDELYDLTADRYELKNVIREPGAAAVLNTMRTDLERLRKEAP